MRGLRRYDHLSLSLLTVATFSLLTGLLLHIVPSHAAIPDQFLDGIRGSNPQVQKDIDDDCTDENVETLTLFDPPGPPSVVAFTGCGAVAPGTTCISCILNRYNKVLQQAHGGPTGWDGANPIAVDCGNQGQGTRGTCSTDSAGNPYCMNPNSYDCTTFGIDYPVQP